MREEIRVAERGIYFRGTRTLSITRDRRWIGQESFYVQHGDWFVLASLAAALLGVGALLTAPLPVPPKTEE